MTVVTKLTKANGCDYPGCDETAPHDHGFVTSPSGNVNSAIIYRVEDPRAEVRDPDTGEVIFPAVKGPLKVIEGGRAALQKDTTDAE